MNKWPGTVAEAVENILSGMKVADKRQVRDTPEEDLIMFHRGWGQGIRNGLGLLKGNTELLEDTGESHPDDASMVIIEAVWKALQSMDDGEIEASRNAINEARLEFDDLQNAASELEDFVRTVVPRDVIGFAKRVNGRPLVIVNPTDSHPISNVEGTIRKFLRNSIPKGIDCSINWNDLSVYTIVSMVDDPLTKLERSMPRCLADNGDQA